MKKSDSAIKPISKLSVLLRVVELGLFCFAFVMAVPPKPSEENHVYHLTPVLLIGGSAFALSLCLAIWRGGENWIVAFLKIGFYVFLAWLIQGRVS